MVAAAPVAAEMGWCVPAGIAHPWRWSSWTILSLGIVKPTVTLYLALDFLAAPSSCVDGFINGIDPQTRPGSCPTIAVVEYIHNMVTAEYDGMAVVPGYDARGLSLAPLCTRCCPWCHNHHNGGNRRPPPRIDKRLTARPSGRCAALMYTLINNILVRL